MTGTPNMGRKFQFPESIRELLPSLIALFAITSVMTIVNHKFLLPSNITNLLLQQAEPAVLALGLVMVLFLGEIDLSVGAVSGFCAAIMASLSVRHGMNTILAIVISLIVGALVGLIQSMWVVTFEIPAFIITLAGLIGWQGGLFAVLGGQGTIGLSDPKIEFLTSGFVSPLITLVVAVIAISIFALMRFEAYRRTKKYDLPGPTVNSIVIQTMVYAAIIVVLLFYFQRDRGFPVSFTIVLAIATVLHLISKYTRFGRQVYAIGGNLEASRRAGIPVKRVRVQVFMIATFCASIAGLLLSSRLSAVSSGAGGGTLLLNSIAAVVIGGTSLFGGRGHIWSAVIGTLIIGAISNGMDLLALASPIKYIVTALVLLSAVTFDSVSRKRSTKNVP
jgi:D-xylose transport system permease protein